MTKDIVETVARALFEDFEGDAERWDNLGDLQEIWRNQARAAITAHQSALSTAGDVIVPREPTEAMVFQGASSYDHPSVYMGGPSHGGRRMSARIWKAMIDASLKETP